MKPSVIVLRAAGSNCDVETGRAFELAGASAELVHVNRLMAGEKRLSDYAILAVPGGFTYGDDVAAGKVLATEVSARLIDEVREFLHRGGLVIGICNGFQVLVKTGFLPGVENMPATLTQNDSQKFEARWICLKVEKSRCAWTSRLTGRIITLPVAHGEGKFMTRTVKDLKTLEKNDQIALKYTTSHGSEPAYPQDPNGSMGHVAGICDITGRVFGLMPHPERFVEKHQHPRSCRGEGADVSGLEIIKCGVAVAAGKA